MGNNAGPHIANIYLHVYEYQYISTLILNNDLVSLKSLSSIFRFQDDLLSLNDNGKFNDVLSDIYPTSMVINNTNISPAKSSYLDLMISVYRGKYRVSLYDKRKDFSFSVISYPFLDGNVPKAQSYGIFISQLVRFSRINSTYNGFYKDVKCLVDKLISQCFNNAALRKKFLKFHTSYIDLWGKFGIDINNKLFLDLFL